MVRLLKSRRGVAIEISIIALVVVFGLCTILTTVSLLAKKEDRMANRALERRVALDMIGEQFLLWVRDDGQEPFGAEDYVCRVNQENDRYSLRLYADEDAEEAILVVILQDDEIVRWDYQE